MPAHPYRTSLAVLALVLATLLGTACSGSDDPATTAAAGPADAATEADAGTTAQDDATAEAAATPQATQAATPAGSTDAEPTEVATPDGEATAAAAGDGPGAEIAGCPAQTELGVTLRRTDGEEQVMPPTTFPAGHFILDLDGDGFGPILAGALTTDPSVDAMALADSWASPEPPTDGQVHITVQLQGPGAGETTYPLGTYGVTESDGRVAPTEGMGLGTLKVHNTDGSARTIARDNQVELTHLGDGVICGTISPGGREPAQSNPVVEMTGEFAATFEEQP